MAENSNTKDRPLGSTGMSWSAIGVALAAVTMVIGINSGIVYWQSNSLKQYIGEQIDGVENRVYTRLLERVLIVQNMSSVVAQRDEVLKDIIFQRIALNTHEQV